MYLSDKDVYDQRKDHRTIFQSLERERANILLQNSISSKRNILYLYEDMKKRVSQNSASRFESRMSYKRLRKSNYDEAVMASHR